MKDTINDRLQFFKRTLPRIDPRNARYMYAVPGDLRRRGTKVKVYVLIWSSDARVSLHETDFQHRPALSVPGWAAELADRAPMVFREFVIPALNEQTGTTWAVDRVVGWHFVKDERRVRR